MDVEFQNEVITGSVLVGDYFHKTLRYQLLYHTRRIYLPAFSETGICSSLLKEITVYEAKKYGKNPPLRMWIFLQYFCCRRLSNDMTPIICFVYSKSQLLLHVYKGSKSSPIWLSKKFPIISIYSLEKTFQGIYFGSSVINWYKASGFTKDHGAITLVI